MSGGLAVRGNVLAVTWSAARGHVLLFDLEAGQRVSAFALPAGRAGFSDAAGVAVDEHYHIFVADPPNDRVCHFNAFGRHLGDFGTPPPATGDAGRDRQGVLDRPHAVAVRGDLLLVAMGEQPRRRGVQRFSRQGTALRALAARGDVELEFGAPRGLWADGAGVVVADTLRGRLQQFAGDGRFVREWVCGSAGQARPIAVVRSDDGRLLYVDRGDRPGVFAFDRGGVAVDCASVRQHCREVVAVTLDRQQRLYVLDHGGERVVRCSATWQFEQVLFDLAELDLDPPHAP